METLNSSAPALGSSDTALSETARELRSKVRSAMDPPDTSRQVRRAAMKRGLWEDAVHFASKSTDPTTIRRLVASVAWSEAFIDTALATTPAPDIAVDTDGEILFEWLNGPREVVTISVGPAGVINFALLAGSDRLHGVTRIGERMSGPLLSYLAQIKASGVP